MSALAALNAPRVRAISGMTWRTERWSNIIGLVTSCVLVGLYAAYPPVREPLARMSAFLLIVWMPALPLAGVVDGFESLAKSRNAVALGATPRDVVGAATRIAFAASLGMLAMLALLYIASLQMPGWYADLGFSSVWLFALFAAYTVFSWLAGTAAGFTQFMAYRRMRQLPRVVQALASSALFIGLTLLAVAALFPVTLWLCHREAQRYRQDLCLQDRG